MVLSVILTALYIYLTILEIKEERANKEKARKEKKHHKKHHKEE